MPICYRRRGCRLVKTLFQCSAAFGFIFLAWPVAAQQPAPADPAQNPQTPTISVTTREVLLDVEVTDNAGRPVTGLTAADFTVTEEGDRQQLTHLEEHHAMSAAEQAPLRAIPALPPNTFTNFTPVANTNSSTVILLDALDMGVQTQMELR